MTETHFVDSNLLVYWRDASEPGKQPRAREWLAYLWAARKGRLSVQVLNEFYVTVTHKLTPGMSRDEAWSDMQAFLAWKPQPIDEDLLVRGRAVQQRFQFAWWDSLIVAAAQALGCRYLLTEDLQDGQDLDGVIVMDPFSHAPSER
ncbi:MAG: PIN domain-containing protein [Kiritimatiellae bacterium]|nr:PIN domain-containing protein [Kiritimatiellia bacterium]